MYGNSDIQIDSFGSIGGSYQVNKNMIYRNDIKTTDGSSGNFSFLTHTNFGTQLQYFLNDKLSFTSQIIAKEKQANEKTLNLEWLYGKYKVTNNLSLKLGNLRNPTFFYSDIQNISNAHLWTHLPQEVYSTVPFSTFKGLELEYNVIKDNLITDFRVILGKGNDETVQWHNDSVSTLKKKNVKGISIDAVFSNITIHSSYIKSEVKNSDEKVQNLINELSRYNVNGNFGIYRDISFKGLGFIYDSLEHFFASEYSQIKVNDNFIGQIDSWYLSYGYKFANFTPYITLSQNKQKRNPKETLTNGQIPSVDEIYTSLIDSGNIVQKTKSIGCRYNISDSSSLKLQYDLLNIDENHQSIMLQKNDKINDLQVFHIKIDFVF
jgi:hypothetical protein